MRDVSLDAMRVLTMIPSQQNPVTVVSGSPGASPHPVCRSERVPQALSGLNPLASITVSQSVMQSDETVSGRMPILVLNDSPLQPAQPIELQVTVFADGVGAGVGGVGGDGVGVGGVGIGAVGVGAVGVGSGVGEGAGVGGAAGCGVGTGTCTGGW